MGRLSAVTDRVLAAIPQAISYHSLKTVLDTSQVPLTNIVRYWNNLYPNTGTNSTQNSTAIQNFGKQIDGDISQYGLRLLRKDPLGDPSERPGRALHAPTTSHRQHSV